MAREELCGEVLAAPLLAEDPSKLRWAAVAVLLSLLWWAGLAAPKYVGAAGLY